MAKQLWKPGTMLYPVPAVLVTSHHAGRENVLTVSWTGTICTEPPMLSISLRPQRFSYGLIAASREFVVNIPTASMVRAVDFCGVKSGAEVDKFNALGLVKSKARMVRAPLIAQCPLAIECTVEDIVKLGSHHLFISRVVAVHADEALIDKKGRFHLERAGLLCYNHGHYCRTSKPIAKFGFSVKRRKR
ncbi:MAG: flavin reductase family protein [Spirochaetes bacterium]|nr:flavin reductase family protein [Spirochaetota bacterium]